jgi:hypothetical protein
MAPIWNLETVAYFGPYTDKGADADQTLTG